MRKLLLPPLMFSFMLILSLTAWFRFFDFDGEDQVISCISNQSTIHGDFLMKGNFDFLFNEGEGRVRINGSTIVSGDEKIVSRQIYYTYIHQQNEYILKSKQIQMMNNGDSAIANSAFNHHFPAFFSKEGKELAVAIRQDKYNNFVIYFADVPAFYCQRKN